MATPSPLDPPGATQEPVSVQPVPATPLSELPLPPEPPPATPPPTDPIQSEHFDRARASLQRAIARYGGPGGAGTAWAAAVGPDLDRLVATLDKLDRFVVRIAAFGLVSRGKSAVLNALAGQAAFETGPLNGVTRIPRSVRWSVRWPDLEREGADDSPSAELGQRPVEVELIDTPGLDEIGGAERAALAREVAGRADLIVFVAAGDLTAVEYAALRELRQAQKPLILTFNKIDLYPEAQQRAIGDRLRSLMALESEGETSTEEEVSPDSLTSPAPRWQAVLPVDEVVLVAAEPAPLQVREEWPDGRVSYGWESPPAEIESLRRAILQVLDREGRALLALNALLQSRQSERRLAHQLIAHLRQAADDNLWQTIRLKTVAIALSPVAPFDLLLGLGADLWAIARLARLYGLPLTRYGLDRFWQTVAASSGLLLAGELGGRLLAGEEAGLLTGGFGPYLASALVQAATAGLGSVMISRATREYLESGCTWGSEGSDTIARDILDRIGPNTVLHRLRQELQQQLDGV